MTQYLYRPSEMQSFACSDERVTEQGWLIVEATQHRDSDAVQISNHRVIERTLSEIDPDQKTWGVMRCGHWAVGWVDHFVVQPSSPAESKILELLISVDEEYAILDEMDCSEVEMERHDEQICDEHCSFCESDRLDHRRGDCKEDCRLCTEEAEEEEDEDQTNDVCPTCGDTFPIVDMYQTGISPSGQIERACKTCHKERS